jgi:hypothetical protein
MRDGKGGSSVRIYELASKLGVDPMTVCEVTGLKRQPNSFINRQQEQMLRAVWKEFPADRPMTAWDAAAALHVDIKYALRHVRKHAGPDSLLNGTSVRSALRRRGVDATPRTCAPDVAPV